MTSQRFWFKSLRMKNLKSGITYSTQLLYYVWTLTACLKNKWRACPLFNSCPHFQHELFMFACINTEHASSKASPARGEASSCTSCAGWASSWLDTAVQPLHPLLHPPSLGHEQRPASPDCEGQRSACLHLKGDGLFRLDWYVTQCLTQCYKTCCVLNGFIYGTMKPCLEKWRYLWY